MEMFKFEELIHMKNPNQDKVYRQSILTDQHNAKKLEGMFVILPAGDEVAYHYHNERESIFIALSGEAIEIVEGKECPMKANDVLFLPAVEKHGTINRTDKEFRFVEISTTSPSGEVDRIYPEKE